MIFHHVYAFVNTVSHEIEELRYIANETEVEAVKTKVPLTTQIVCCDDYDCKAGDLLYNNQIYHKDADGNFIWVRKGVKYS